MTTETEEKPKNGHENGEKRSSRSPRKRSSRSRSSSRSPRTRRGRSSRSPDNKRSRSPGKDKKEAAEADKGVDREKICPFLLRVFCSKNRHNRVEDYFRGRLPSNELQIYTWLDASLKELTNLVKEVNPEYRMKGTIFEFSVVKFLPVQGGGNRMRGRFGDQDYEMINIGDTEAGLKGSDDAKALRDTKFQIGDYLDIAISRGGRRDNRGFGNRGGFGGNRGFGNRGSFGGGGFGGDRNGGDRDERRGGDRNGGDRDERRGGGFGGDRNGGDRDDRRGGGDRDERRDRDERGGRGDRDDDRGERRFGRP